MKLKVFLLSAILSFGLFANATYIPTQATLTVGGRVFTDAFTNSNFKILHCAMGASANCSVRKQDGTSGYLPSGSNNFRIDVVKVVCAATGILSVAHTTNDLGVSEAVSPTGTVYYGGHANNTLELSGSCVAGEIHYHEIDFVIPNATYLSFISTGQFSVTVYGYEIP